MSADNPETDEPDSDFVGWQPFGPLKWIEKAERYSDVNRLELAEKELRQGLSEYPDSSVLHAHLAWCLSKQTRKEEAREEATTALAGDVENVLARIVLADVEAERGHHREAERILLEGLHQEPRNVQLLMMYAGLIAKVRQYPKAKALWETVLAIQPENEYAHAALSTVLSQMKEAERAHAHGEKALKLDPEAETSHWAMGIAAITSGRPFLAKRHFREALRLDPTDPRNEQMFKVADRMTRPTMLPFYYYSHLASKIPGGALAFWIGLLLATRFLTTMPATAPFANPASTVILFFALYTWVAEPITNVWIKFFPPRLYERNT